jgi:hypothetical protein
MAIKDELNWIVHLTGVGNIKMHNCGVCSSVALITSMNRTKLLLNCMSVLKLHPSSATSKFVLLLLPPTIFKVANSIITRLSAASQTILQ